MAVFVVVAGSSWISRRRCVRELVVDALEAVPELFFVCRKNASSGAAGTTAQGGLSTLDCTIRYVPP